MMSASRHRTLSYVKAAAKPIRYRACSSLAGAVHMTIPAKSVMTTDIVTVSPETTIVETARRMLIHHVSAVPVVDPITGRLDWSAKAT